MRMQRRWCLLGAVALGVGAGCADLNARNTLGGRGVVEAVAPSGRAAPTSDPASLARGLDRSVWRATVVEVYVDGTVSGPTYARQRLYDRRPAERRGMFPSAESALSLEREANVCLRVAETAAQAPRALVDLALMPLRAVFDPPWERVQSPMYLYKRQAERERGWLTGGKGPATGDQGPGNAGPPAVGGGAPETGHEGGHVEPVFEVVE